MKAVRTRRKATPNLESKTQAFFPKTSNVVRKKDVFFNSAIRKKANEEEKVAAQAANEKEKETTAVQKKGEEEKDKVSKKEADDDRSSKQMNVQKKEEEISAKSNAEKSESHDSFEAALNQKSSTGFPLPDDIRAEMEDNFGASFDDVRIHTDAEASRLCGMINAVAFTNGYNIYFASGKFNPGTSEGKKLLAHELAHVIQQA